MGIEEWKRRVRLVRARVWGTQHVLVRYGAGGEPSVRRLVT